MAASKEHILDEIRRAAKDNGGESVGAARFEKETGIRPHEWQRYWARWSAATREAGLTPNSRNPAIEETVLLDATVRLIRDLGCFPSKGEMVVRKRTDPLFPNPMVIYNRFGSILGFRTWVFEKLKDRPDLVDVAPLCAPTAGDGPARREAGDRPEDGFVYLLKAGRHYKIGRSNASGRREYEIRLQMPEKLTKVHEIKTDDPPGIEAYWHNRFGAKRLNGEWFELDSADVSAFRRRKFM